MYDGYTMYHEVCFTCVKGSCVHVGYIIYHKVCFTCVKESCVLSIQCTTRCVLPV